MATTAAPVSRRALQARSIAEAFRITAEDFPDRVAVRTKDDEISITWGELRERVDALAGGLAALGVQRGDTVALMLSNRPEFHLADLAVMSLGAVPFSIYLTSAPEQIAYVVQDAGAKVAIVEEEYLAKLPELEHIVVLEGAHGEGTLAWADVEGSNPGFDVDRLLTAPLSVNLLRYTKAQGREFYQRAVERMQQVPGVKRAAVARPSLVAVRITLRRSAASVRRLARPSSTSGATERVAVERSTSSSMAISRMRHSARRHSTSSASTCTGVSSRSPTQ